MADLYEADILPPSPSPDADKKESHNLPAIEKSDVPSSIPTPDSTPTKEDHQRMSKSNSSKNLSQDLDLEQPPPSPTEVDHTYSRTPEREASPTDSPRPTQPKILKNDTDSSQTSKRSNGKKKGRSRKKKGTVEAQAEGKPTTTSNSKQSSKSSKKSVAETNHKVTEFFPVRRSSRKPAVELKKQKQSELEDMILSECIDGLKVVDIEGKGRGVISTKPFKKGDFVVEYQGNLLDHETAKKKEAEYSKNPDFGCYMYYFVHENKKYCVDATAETGKLGRLLNHSRQTGNCCTRVVGINGRPYLILVAARNISIGEELLYDYGDRSKESLEAHPWLAY